MHTRQMFSILMNMNHRSYNKAIALKAQLYELERAADGRSRGGWRRPRIAHSAWGGFSKRWRHASFVPARYFKKRLRARF